MFSNRGLDIRAGQLELGTLLNGETGPTFGKPGLAMSTVLGDYRATHKTLESFNIATAP